MIAGSGAFTKQRQRDRLTASGARITYTESDGGEWRRGVAGCDWKAYRYADDVLLEGGTRLSMPGDEEVGSIEEEEILN